MNNKHISCAVVGGLILLMMQWTNVSYEKLKAANDSEVISRSSYDSAVIARTTEQRKMVILKRKTEVVRKYLSQWDPYINQIKSAQFGEAFINMKIKQAKIITISQTFDTVKRENGLAIPHMLNAQIVLEDDYVKVFNWLAKLESSVPSARVSSCKLTKGQSGNDLKMDLSIDLPIVKVKERKVNKIKMKKFLIFNLSVSLSLVIIFLDHSNGEDLFFPDQMNEQKSNLGILPKQKKERILEFTLTDEERNPFVISKNDIDIEEGSNSSYSEETKIRSILDSLVVNGISRGANSYKVQLGGLILEKGKILPRLINDQTDDLKVTEITSSKVQITWVGDEEADKPRVMTIPIELEPKVGVELPSAFSKSLPLDSKLIYINKKSEKDRDDR